LIDKDSTSSNSDELQLDLVITRLRRDNLLLLYISIGLLKRMGWRVTCMESV